MKLQFLDRTEIYMKLKHEGKEHSFIHKQPLCVRKSHHPVAFDRIFTGKLLHVWLNFKQKKGKHLMVLASPS